MRWAAPALAGLLCWACTDESTAGCNEENVRTMVDSCRTVFAGDPLEICVQAGAQPVLADQVELCEALGGGQLAECLASRKAECDAAWGDTFNPDEELYREVYLACEAEADQLPSRDCLVGDCTNRWLLCGERCPRDDAGACRTCALACRDAYVECVQTCT